MSLIKYAMSGSLKNFSNKLDKISFAEVLNKIFTLNKQLDPALENMADVSNDEASNLRISKPILQFFDQKVEMDYTDYCDMKVTVPYITYLFSLALFLAIDIAIKNYEPQKLAKVIYILLGALLIEIKCLGRRRTLILCSILFTILVTLCVIYLLPICIFYFRRFYS